MYYPHQFRALRRMLYAGEDSDALLESLSRCQSWAALGGKSGSTFQKTLDHRFVLKLVKQNEFRMFLVALISCRTRVLSTPSCTHHSR